MEVDTILFIIFPGQEVSATYPLLLFGKHSPSGSCIRVKVDLVKLRVSLFQEGAG
jgi:hypothetical protein